MSELKPSYLFGDFKLNVSTREIIERSKALEVQPLVFDFLVFLVENRHRMVTTQELLDTIWHDSVVTEESLRLCVAKARKLLHDTVESQYWIKSDAHGCQFVGNVRIESKNKSGNISNWVFLPIACVLMAFTVVWLLPEAGQSESLESPEEPRAGVAVLPVTINDDTSDENAWIELGLMGLLNRKFQYLPWLNVTSEAKILSLTDVYDEWRENTDDFDDLKYELVENHHAQYLLVTEISTANEEYKLTFRLFSNGSVVDTGYYISDRPAQLVQALFEKFVLSVTGQLPHRENMVIDSDNEFVIDAYLRGISLQIQGRAGEAAKYFRSIVELEPDAFWPKYEYASALRRYGSLEEARVIFDDLLVQDLPPRERFWALSGAGVVADIQRRLDDAVSLYSEAGELVNNSELVPEQIVLLINMAITYRKQKRLHEAKELLESAIELSYQFNEKTHLTSIHGTLGIIFQHTGNHEKAIEHYSKGVEFARLVHDKRRESIASNNLAMMFFGVAQLEKAEAQFTRALLLRQSLDYKPGILSTGSVMGELYQALGQYTNAREKLLMAAETAFDMKTPRLYWQVSALNRLSQVEALLGNWKEARQRYHQAKDIVENAPKTDALSELQYRVRLSAARLAMLEANYPLAQEQAEQVYQELLARSTGEFAERARVVEFSAMEILCSLAVKSDFDFGDIQMCIRMVEQSDESVLPFEKGRRMLWLARVSIEQNEVQKAINVVNALPADFSKSYEFQVLQARIAFKQGNIQLAEVHKNLALKVAFERTEVSKDLGF